MRRNHRFARFALLLCLASGAGLGRAGAADSEPAGSSESPAIVIGFVGGYVSHDNPVHAEVQLAARLKHEYAGQNVHVEAFENHRAKQARQEIVNLLDTDHDGSLSVGEKQHARIILYGHSWGASESVYLARELGKEGIPVLLTIQVDSVEKSHRNDSVIPANVAQAVNFYQSKGLVRGESRIRAADPERTRILGNFRFDYAQHPISCSSYPWWDRYLVRSHTEIECDPVVWQRVEELIRSILPVPGNSLANNLSN